MTDTAGLVIYGDDSRNKLHLKVVTAENGDRSIYNVILAGGGNDILDGRAFTSAEAAVLGTYGVQFFGEDGNDKLIDSVGTDTLNGGAGNDHITWTSGVDTIDGGDGTDTLIIAASTRLSSKSLSISGIERLQIDGTTQITDLDLEQFDVITGDQRAGPTHIEFHRQVTIEHVEFIGNPWDLLGSDDNDTFDLLASRRKFHLNAGGGDDVIIGGQKVNELSGGDGDDHVTGGPVNDWLSGGGGNDTVIGGDGNDYFLETSGGSKAFGGNGRDEFQFSDCTGEISGEEGGDTIVLKNGMFTVDGGEDSDQINIDFRQIGQFAIASGGDGNDHFLYKGHGSDAAVTLHGGAGTDVLQLAGRDLSHLVADGVERLSLTGTDLLIGADTLGSFAGVDSLPGDYLQIKLSAGGSFVWHSIGHQPKFSTLSGSDETDKMDLSDSQCYWTVKGGGGDDVVVGGSYSNVINGGDGDDLLVGRARWDSLAGSAGNDTLVGYGRDDRLFGGDGDDVFIAGAGVDYVHGEGGNDTYVFADGIGGTIVYDYGQTAGDRDTIDFSRVTTIKNFHDLIVNHLKMVDHDHVLLITFGTSEIALPGIKGGDLDDNAFIF